MGHVTRSLGEKMVALSTLFFFSLEIGSLGFCLAARKVVFLAACKYFRVRFRCNCGTPLFYFIFLEILLALYSPTPRLRFRRGFGHVSRQSPSL